MCDSDISFPGRSDPFTSTTWTARSAGSTFPLAHPWSCHMTRIKRIIDVFAAALCITGVALPGAQAQPAPGKPATAGTPVKAAATPGDKPAAKTAAKSVSAEIPVPDIQYTKFVLKNGLTLLVHEDHKTPVVAVNTWYHVGSKNEKPGKTGFAHLFEHLMFSGSDNFNYTYINAMEDRRDRPERHHQQRSDELFRECADIHARFHAVRRERSHGPPARGAG